MRRILLTAATCLIAATVSSAASQSIIVKVACGSSAWGSCQLGEKLRNHLTRESGFRVIDASEAPGLPAFPGDIYDLDGLVGWGQEVGGRFLLLVNVQGWRIETRKSRHLPLIFHRYQTVGVIEGELRYVDLSRGKLVTAGPFRVEQAAATQWQATAYTNVNDPDLKLSATAKVRLFDRLEGMLCLELLEKVGLTRRGR